MKEISDQLEQQLKKLLKENSKESPSHKKPQKTETRGSIAEKPGPAGIRLDYVDAVNAKRRMSISTDSFKDFITSFFRYLWYGVFRYDLAPGAAASPAVAEGILEKVYADNPKDEYEHIYPGLYRIKEGYTVVDPDEEKISVKGFFSRPRNVLGLIAAILIVLAAAYVAMSFPYSTQFKKGTFINGMDVSDMTVEEVEEDIRENVENYDLTLDLRGGEKIVIPGEDLGYRYVSTGKVQQIKDGQPSYTWITGVFGRTAEYTADTAVDYDADKLNAVLDSNPSFDEQKETLPEDAHIAWMETEYQIIPEVEGDFIKRDELMEKLDSVLKSQSRTLDLEAEGLYLAPTVRSDDKHMKEIIDSANPLVDACVTYQVPAGEVTASQSLIKEWLIEDPKTGLFSLDDERLKQKCSEFVASLAANYNTVGENMTFHSTNWGDVKVDAISYGWKIDEAAETENLFNDIKAHNKVTREPAWEVTGVTLENGGIGNTYIEVDVLSQHVFCYKDGKLIIDTDCVTGAEYLGRKTVYGVFPIRSMSRNVVLEGEYNEEGKPSYSQFVYFWMPFYGGYGLHDATWRGSFGGDIYLYSGSHGCVNLPYEKAEQIFESYEAGTPVVVFKHQPEEGETVDSEESYYEDTSPGYDEDYYDDDDEDYDDDEEDYDEDDE